MREGAICVTRENSTKVGGKELKREQDGDVVPGEEGTREGGGGRGKTEWQYSTRRRSEGGLAT